MMRKVVLYFSFWLWSGFILVERILFEACAVVSNFFPLLVIIIMMLTLWSKSWTKFQNMCLRLMDYCLANPTTIPTTLLLMPLLSYNRPALEPSMKPSRSLVNSWTPIWLSTPPHHLLGGGGNDANAICFQPACSANFNSNANFQKLLAYARKLYSDATCNGSWDSALTKVPPSGFTAANLFTTDGSSLDWSIQRSFNALLSLNLFCAPAWFWLYICGLWLIWPFGVLSSTAFASFVNKSQRYCSFY